MTRRGPLVVVARECYHRAMSEVLDLTGEVCPFTFVRARLALEALPIGAALEVIVDHPPAARNVPRSAREWGQEVVAVDQLAPGRWRIALVKRVA